MLQRELIIIIFIMRAPRYFQQGVLLLFFIYMGFPVFGRPQASLSLKISGTGTEFTQGKMMLDFVLENQGGVTLIDDWDGKFFSNDVLRNSNITLTAKTKDKIYAIDPFYIPMSDDQRRGYFLCLPQKSKFTFREIFFLDLPPGQYELSGNLHEYMSINGQTGVAKTVRFRPYKITVVKAQVPLESFEKNRNPYIEDIKPLIEEYKKGLKEKEQNENEGQKKGRTVSIEPPPSLSLKISGTNTEFTQGKMTLDFILDNQGSATLIDDWHSDSDFVVMAKTKDREYILNRFRIYNNRPRGYILRIPQKSQLAFRQSYFLNWPPGQYELSGYLSGGFKRINGQSGVAQTVKLQPYKITVIKSQIPLEFFDVARHHPDYDTPIKVGVDYAKEREKRENGVPKESQTAPVASHPTLALKISGTTTEFTQGKMTLDFVMENQGSATSLAEWFGESLMFSNITLTASTDDRVYTIDSFYKTSDRSMGDTLKLPQKSQLSFRETFFLTLPPGQYELGGSLRENISIDGQAGLARTVKLKPYRITVIKAQVPLEAFYNARYTTPENIYLFMREMQKGAIRNLPTKH